MLRSRFFAVAVILTLLLGADLLWSPEPARPTFSTPFTEQPPLIAAENPILVDAQILEQRAAEPQLIADALVATTNPPTTTTTTPPTTTTTTTLPTSSTTDTTSSPSSTSSPSTTAPPATSPPTTAAGGYVSGAESEFASRINSFRGSNGLAPLSGSGSLDSYARSWAKQLAERGTLAHSDISSLLGEWTSVGENVGVGGSVSAIFDALASSPGHRENMLGDFTHVGIGVYQDSDGTLWTAHVFAR